MQLKPAGRGFIYRLHRPVQKPFAQSIATAINPGGGMSFLATFHLCLCRLGLLAVFIRSFTAGWSAGGFPKRSTKSNAQAA